MIMGEAQDAKSFIRPRRGGVRHGRIGPLGGLLWHLLVAVLVIQALASCASTREVDWESAPPLTKQASGQHGRASVLVVAWGTPSDEGLAGKSENRAYSRQLAGLVQTVVHDLWGESVYTAVGIPAASEFRRLVTEPPPYSRSAQLCRDHVVDAIFFCRVERSEYMGTGMGYAHWREPYFAVFDCATASRVSDHPRVYDRPGEAFPYSSELGIAFRRFVLEQRSHLPF